MKWLILSLIFSIQNTCILKELCNSAAFSFYIFLLLSSPYNKILSQILLTQQICRLVHLKMLIVSSFTQHHVVPNLCNFIFSFWNTEDILKNRFCPYNQSHVQQYQHLTPLTLTVWTKTTFFKEHNIFCVLQKKIYPTDLKQQQG